MRSEPYIESLSGSNLECFVAALYHAEGYYVTTNLTYRPITTDGNAGKSLMEIDVMAIKFTPTGEQVTIIECKGGGRASEALVFSGIASLIKPHKAIFICNHPKGEEENIRHVCNNGNIDFYLLSELTTKYNFDENYKRIVDAWYQVEVLLNSFLDPDKLSSALGVTKIKSSNYFTAYQSIMKLNGTRLNPAWLAAKSSQKKYEYIGLLMMSHRAFPLSCTRVSNIKCSKVEDAFVKSPIADVAASEVLQLRIEWITSALRIAYEYAETKDSNLFKGMSVQHIESIKLMASNLSFYCKIPYFFQLWSLLFGGMLNKQNENLLLATILNTDVNSIKILCECIENFFSIMLGATDIQLRYLVTDRGRSYEIMNIGNSIRGCSISFRTEIGLPVSAWPHGKGWEKRYNLWSPIYT